MKEGLSIPQSFSHIHSHSVSLSLPFAYSLLLATFLSISSLLSPPLSHPDQPGPPGQSPALTDPPSLGPLCLPNGPDLPSFNGANDISFIVGSSNLQSDWKNMYIFEKLHGYSGRDPLESTFWTRMKFCFTIYIY